MPLLFAYGINGFSHDGAHMASTQLSQTALLNNFNDN